MRVNVRESRQAALTLLLEEDAGPIRGRKQRLAARIKKAPAQVSQWLSGYRTIDEETAREIEKRAKKPPRWMDDVGKSNANPDHSASQAPMIAGAGIGVPLAHAMSDLVPMIEPIPIEWESTMYPDLPPLFRVAAPDDAMAPRISKGNIVIFSTTEGAPRPNDVVLVADDNNRWAIRSYELRRPGHWRAVAAAASGYNPLDSQLDGLKVLGIYVGQWGRLG